jgi:hypothetical protein
LFQDNELHFVILKQVQDDDSLQSHLAIDKRFHAKTAEIMVAAGRPPFVSQGAAAADLLL